MGHKVENNIPASENFESKENSNYNPNAFYGPNNYGSSSQPPQYNNYPYNAPYPNNQQYNPYLQQQVNFGIYENYYQKNIPSEPLTSEELHKMQSVSIGSICVFVFWLILLIFVIAFAIATAASYALPSTSIIPTTPSSSLNNYLSLNAVLICFEAIFGFFWVMGNLVCAVVCAVRAYELSIKSRSFMVVMILYIIGIFIPIFQLIAACISLSKIKQCLTFYQPSY